MKKAVLFCPSKVWGGIEKNVLLRARFLGERGIEVYVVLLNDYFADRFVGLKNVTVVEVKSRGGDLNLSVLIRYVRFLREISPDVVFAALKKDWWLVSFASRLAGVSRIILYLGISRNIKTIKYRFIFGFLKAKVLVNSDSLKNELLKNTTFFNDMNLFRVYNGFVLPDFTGESWDLRARFGLPDNAILVGCAGRFSPQKGFDLLPDIVANLPETAHVVHVGRGEFEQQIKNVISTREESSRIHFLGFQDDMSLFFRSIDAFLLCSRNEGMANVLNEALSYGKPVVSTKVPGSEELLDGGKYGILTEIEDTEAMAAGLQSIISGRSTFDPSLLRDWIETQFSLQKMLQETEKVFFEV